MRVRKPHRKSRGGCVQCRARRIKCDETKSKCVKCTIHKISCSFSESPGCPASFQTDLQDDSVITYDLSANDPMRCSDQNIYDTGSDARDLPFPLLNVESWLHPCWSMRDRSLPSVGLLPAIQSNSVFTAVNMEDSVWKQTQTMLPIFNTSLQDSIRITEDFSIGLGNPQTSMKSSCQLPKDSPTTIAHSVWEDVLLFLPSPVAAIKESIIFEPNHEVNLGSDTEQDSERTSLYGISPRTDTTSKHTEQ